MLFSLYIHIYTRHTHMNLIHRIFLLQVIPVLYCILSNIHTYMHACTHAYMHTCIHAYMHTCIHASMHPCIHASMHPCIHASMHPCIHASMHPCIHASMHPSIHTYIYIHIFKGLRLTARRRPSNLGTMLALCWAYVGLCWDYVGPCWAILGAMLGPCLGHLCWNDLKMPIFPLRAQPKTT